MRRRTKQRTAPSKETGQGMANRKDHSLEKSVQANRSKRSAAVKYFEEWLYGS